MNIDELNNAIKNQKLYATTDIIIPKIKFEFMGKEFEIESYAIDGTYLVVLSALMLRGKEYYKLLKQLHVQIGPPELWRYIQELYDEDLK